MVVSINKQGFLLNPTNCAALATESTVTSTFGATQSLSSPFQVGNCNLLKFKPAFKAATSSKTSKANGASLETTLNQVPRAGEPQVGQGAAAQGAALAPDDAAESVPGGDVRSRLPQLSERLVRRRRAREHADAARAN